jgi:hypothetical protein
VVSGIALSAAIEHLSFRALKVRFNGAMIHSTTRRPAMSALMLASVLALTGCGSPKTPPRAAPVAPAVPAATPRKALPGFNATGTTVLFDGKTLNGWEVTDFAGHGPVTVANGEIRVGMGHMSGITLINTNGLPRTGYEVSLDAMRVDGSDFFCGLTFPVGKDHCSFIVGGWGGGVVGLSSLDGDDASQNETTSYMNFANNRWFHIRVRVEPQRIQAWIDGDRVANVDITDRRIGIRLEMESCIPLGLATWNTAAAWKNIQVTKL